MLKDSAINCDRAGELALDFLEGQLPEDKRRRIEKHMRDCPPCLQFIETYRKTGQLCRKALMSKAPREFASRLKAFLREKCPKNRS